ncbi:MAG: biotin--[acetyl-CoA-carboxylase] ligase [Paludibacter sp.]
MSYLSFHLRIPSTNALLWEMIRENNLPEGYTVMTDYQSAGKGQSGNSWESTPGRNLLFSMVLYPHHIKPDEQFLISQLVSVSIKNALDYFTDDITVKWPNDIYWKDKKIAGILIENSLQGSLIKSVVVGIGLNVNQTLFISDAPNPVSLKQITGNTEARKSLLNSIRENIMDLYLNWDANDIRSAYSGNLYRKEGFHPFKDDNGMFQAKIKTVHPDGQLELETETGERKGYYFKEVNFVI